VADAVGRKAVGRAAARRQYINISIKLRTRTVAPVGYSNSDVPVIYFIQRCHGDHALCASRQTGVSFFQR
jgi:hypothetical protein